VYGITDVVLDGLHVRSASGTWAAAINITDSSRITVRNSVLSDNRHFGVRIADSTDVVVEGNEITRNSTGIIVERKGSGVRIEGNRIHTNDRMIVDDPAIENDFGAMGIMFDHTTGPVLARGNTLHGNRAPSTDYGYDGSAFEIFGASGITMDGNVTYDNQNVLETGTSGTPCRNNTFTRNVAWGGNDKRLVSPRGPQTNGMLLRCAENMLVAHNTFHDHDYFTWKFGAEQYFSSSINGLTIVNNIASQSTWPVYWQTSTVPSTVRIDRNLAWSSAGGNLAFVEGRGYTSSFETFRRWTGLEATGMNRDPLFRDAGRHDFRLADASPAIDAGEALAVSGSWVGAAPDLGALEHQGAPVPPPTTTTTVAPPPTTTTTVAPTPTTTTTTTTTTVAPPPPAPTTTTTTPTTTTTEAKAKGKPAKAEAKAPAKKGAPWRR
jgi:parallel beta-helix repeat protein